MGPEDKIKPEERTKCSIFCLMFMVSTVVPVGGFFLKGCNLSNTTVKCAITDSKLETIPQDIPPTVAVFDLSKNCISRIQPSDFPHLPVLKWLNVQQNQISLMDSFAFSGLRSLRKLTLNTNKLVKLVENVFGGLGNLTELRLNTNQIKTVSSTSFRSLTSLKILDISNNKLHKVSNVHLILQHLPHLQELGMRGNGLRRFHSWELTNCSLGLRALDLSRNPLRVFSVTDDVFPDLTRFIIGDASSNMQMKWDLHNKSFLSRVASLDISGLYASFDDKSALLESVNSSLTSLALNRMKRMNYTLAKLIILSCTIPSVSTLQVRNNKLKIINQNMFQLCVNVIKLDLTQNQIQTIHENAFVPLKNLKTLILSLNKLSSVPTAVGSLHHLETLVLSSNKIAAVKCDDFANHEKLVELKLNNNSISVLDHCVFKDLVKLQVLKLQSNEITDFKSAFEKHLPKLKQLHLNGNKLTAIKKGAFQGLRSLLNLTLHKNKIKTIDANGFAGLTNLTELQLHSNALKSNALETGAFNSLIRLRRLDLSNNNIKYSSSTALKKSPFSQLSQLEELSIRGQRSRGKSYLPRNILQGLAKLRRFSVRNSQLIHLDAGTLKDAPELEELDVSSNDLPDLSAELFSSTGMLKSLYISRTSLLSLDFFIDANLTKLEFLQARKNQYSVITEEVIESLPALVYVDLWGNSFTCDCDNAWFLNWSIASRQTQVYDASNFLCNYPEGFKGKHFLDFDLISCSAETGFICYVSTTCMVLCFLVATFTYHFMRWQLYCAYYFFLAWLYDKKHEYSQTPHQYDAFISYNTHDEPWVVGELLPKLEGEQGWRLCLHHRDFQPGRPIVDNISDAIYGSRKTICVISHRYLESEWCSREVQTASFRLFDEQKDVLILVFLEDIPTYLLSPYHRMRKLLKKQTYLSWPRAADHPEVFWEKLRQALQTGENLNQHNLDLIVLQTQ
ncbi:toll-like receptor 13 [Nothobranchius furzeri]|uniref:Toll-like receptor 13 n=1 Tax=Nothobranchius furzeri TaxID=105023 RepID=A0A9D2Y4Z1_NOTFU|nr:toll-like receptor 13 [Nothobranchius furzeri]